MPEHMSRAELATMAPAVAALTRFCMNSMRFCSQPNQQERMLEGGCVKRKLNTEASDQVCKSSRDFWKWSSLKSFSKVLLTDDLMRPTPSYRKKIVRMPMLLALAPVLLLLLAPAQRTG